MTETTISARAPFATWYRRVGKRALDCCIAGVLIVVGAPLFALVAFAVRIFLGRPVIFRQPRPGKNAKAFVLLKFRTMSNARGNDGAMLPDAMRLGRFGKILRATSLDELPELINVLRGEMSLVGPRPLLMEYVPLYSPEQQRRHEVLPGITGWAQVNGRNAASWPERFAMDVWYADHVSLSLDLRILAMTAKKVFSREGVTQPGQATVEMFRGNAVHEDE